MARRPSIGRTFLSHGRPYQRPPLPKDTRHSMRRGCRRHGRGTGAGVGIGIVRLDLQSYLLDSGGPCFIQNEYDRLVGRVLVRANENPDIVVGLVELLKSW